MRLRRTVPPRGALTRSCHEKSRFVKRVAREHDPTWTWVSRWKIGLVLVPSKTILLLSYLGIHRALPRPLHICRQPQN
jgi:hypothetical protein